MQQDDNIDLLDLWRVLWANRWVIAATTGLAVAIGVVYLAVATPEYRATTVISEVSKSGRDGGAAALIGQFGGLAGLAGLDLGGGASQDDGRTLLQSRTFAEEFITRNDLLPVLFPDADPDNLPKVSSGAGVLREAYTLTFDRESGLFTFSIEWTDPEMAYQWANGMIELANLVARERDIQEAERSIAYLNEQITTTNVVELQRVLYSLLETEMKSLMLANARDEYVFHVVDPALLPGSPAKPKRTIILILSVMLGLLAGFAAIYVRTVAARLREYG